MEIQHLKPLGSFYASTAQEAKKDKFLVAEPSEKKRKYQHDSEGEKNSGVSTELTLSSRVPSKINKPRIKEINYSADNEINAIVVSTLLENEVSTELKLFDESWFTAFAATREEPVVSKESSDSESKSLVQNIEEITSSPEDERKASPMHDVSTIQMLSDPWKIKKKLTGSDLGNLCRLLVASLSVRNHILPLLSGETVEQIEKDGAPVPIWDCDTNTEQHMVLKHWRSSNSYVFIKGWMIQFVKRRNLVEGDLIGIYWDPSNSRFNFSVLQRA
ncbi:B3 domain-containing protein At2g33720-like [Hevea brasiliensis]|uniref:B3 domain-containing protein At2g33720-like n=1 Tax=Hevea brasiliensis TaxID=3981 RepID=UPI0025F93255|nr:B3 domain-containing protein At2g33720-like [Hevea brasiliensis]